jgi:RimJ/RimL family protein N-acetyltransferase
MQSPSIQLTATTANDLEVLFEFQRDTEGVFMAAFTPKEPGDKDNYVNRYSGFIVDPSIIMMTIWLNDRIVGSISRYVMEGDHEITYWIDRKYWGRGIATNALKMFLEIDEIRPLFGRTAIDNIGSQRVLQNNGFLKIGEDSGFANGRQLELQELIFKLE